MNEIQPTAAAAIALLTIILAWATASYARTAKRQLDEMIGQREAEYRPYLHAASATVQVQPAELHMRSMKILLHVANVGKGPALGVRAYLGHEYMGFAPRGNVDAGNTAPKSLRGGPWLLRSGGELGLFFEVTKTGKAARFSQKGDFRVEYRDLAGKLWQTRVPVVFEGKQPESFNLTDVTVAFDDANEKVGAIGQATISPDGLELLNAKPKKGYAGILRKLCARLSGGSSTGI